MGIRDSWQSAGNNNEGGYELLPAGTYDCETYDLQHEAGMDGVMRSELTCTIMRGAHEGRRIWIKVKHADSMTWLMRAIWDAHGFSGAPWDGLEDDAGDEAIWGNWGRMVYEGLGCTIRVKVDHWQWQGRDGEERTSLSVKSVESIRDPGPAATVGDSPAPW